MTATFPASAATPSSRAEQPPWFTAELQSDGRMALAGELDISGLDALRTALDQALFEPGEVVHVDAAELSFIDSRALSELLFYQLAAAAQRRQILFDLISSPVARVLDLLDLRHTLMSSEPYAAEQLDTDPL